MTNRSRNIFLGISAVVFAVFLITLIAIGAYSAGRKSVIVPGTEGSIGSSEAAVKPSTSDENVTTRQQIDETIENGSDANGETVEGLTTEQNKPVTTVESFQTESTISSTLPVSPGLPLNLDEEDLLLLLEVWDIVDREFDGRVPTEDEIKYGAIIGSLELLEDRFTRFYPPELAERTREQMEGSFEGIGAYVDVSEEGYLLIVRPIEGQPADSAGLRSGDLVTRVNGNSILGMTLEEMIAEVKGPEGTSVTLTIMRQDPEYTFDVTIVRKLIVIPLVESEKFDGGIVYARLTSFSSNATSQLQEVLEELLSDDAQGLIIDLRDNPGGFLNQSVSVADLFLDEGTILIQRDSGGDEEVFRSDNGDLAEEIPLVVLVNEGSASASEIVAGAIKDRERGVLIGQTTFGKGSVQQTHTLSDSSELRVTIARWYTPANLSIDQTGITPNIEVETPETFGGEEDTQLQRAIRFLSNGE